ncbi:pilus assembly FimT family protein [Helicobacter sp. T3_23-1056]
MRASFSLLEIVFGVVILGLFVFFAMPNKSINTHISLQNATLHTLSHIRYTQHLALNDSLDFANTSQASTLSKMHPSISPDKLTESNKNFWQIQFHQSGIYTPQSFSIFFDTPRFSPTTDRDEQPSVGDIIAVSGKNKRCLSGYSNINISIECRNNAEISVRLGEFFGIDFISLDSNFFCQEMGTFRIKFDRFGKPYCGKNALSLNAPLKITLHKKEAKKSICILPNTGYAFISQNGEC